MFSQTLARVSGGAFGPPVVVCNDEHRFLVAEELRENGIAAQDIILEPAARNTAPAIAVAALRLAESDGDAIMLVLPSDHLIESPERFREDVHAAAALAADGHLVTFGINPTRPETGFGYIQQGGALGDIGWQVARFVEKPDSETAERYIADGGYHWNAGMFLFRAKALIEETRAFHPEIVDAAEQALARAETDLDFLRLDKTAFEAAPAISIDYAIMEQTERAAVVPLNSAWSDVGSWDSLAALGPSDENGNVVTGEAVLNDVQNSFIHSDKSLVAALGIEGMVIVVTDDAVLVLPKNHAQDVKGLVEQMRAESHGKTISHTRVYRPWGHYQNLEEGDGFLVKRIVVNPGAKLSLQYHHHRAEHWIVVAGTARVTNGEEVIDLGPNQSTYIPLGAPHRLENPGDQPLHLIEVQSGDYIGEDDIVRLEDTYGRG